MRRLRNLTVRNASRKRNHRQFALASPTASRYTAGLVTRWGDRVEGGVMAENAGDLVVETARLTKIYQNRQIALNDVSLRIERGWVLGLLGPNGAGKTTFLRLCLGLHRPTAGCVKVFGRKMTPNAAFLR